MEPKEEAIVPAAKPRKPRSKSVATNHYTQLTLRFAEATLDRIRAKCVRLQFHPTVQQYIDDLIQKDLGGPVPAVRKPNPDDKAVWTNERGVSAPDSPSGQIPVGVDVAGNYPDRSGSIHVGTYPVIQKNDLTPEEPVA